MTTQTTEAATPETDAKASPHIGFYSCATVPAEFARKLERERDEWYYKAHANVAFTLEARAERDEARNKMADALQEVDLRNLDFERMKQERDEAREKAERYRLEANALMLKVMEGAK